MGIVHDYGWIQKLLIFKKVIEFIAIWDSDDEMGTILKRV